MVLTISYGKYHIYVCKFLDLYTRNSPPANPPATPRQIKIPGKSIKMVHHSSPATWDAICWSNRNLEKDIFLRNGRSRSLKQLPSEWTEHPRCEVCKLYADLLVQPPGKNSHLKAEEGVEYAFTLTMSPDYQPAKPLPEVAKKILEHGLTNKPYEKASEYAFVLEHTDKGTPHIHGVYKTPSGRRIATKYFQRYWPLWDEKVKLGHGHKGGYHAKARHSESYAAYLEKEGVVCRSIADISDPETSAEPIQVTVEKLESEEFNPDIISYA